MSVVGRTSLTTQPSHGQPHLVAQAIEQSFELQRRASTGELVALVVGVTHEPLGPVQPALNDLNLLLEAK